MTSEILVRRYDKMFSLYDSNRNGYVEESDIARLQGQFLAMFGESPMSERGAGVAKLWDDYWHALLAATDHVADGRISLQEWREGFARLAGDEASHNPPTPRRLVIRRRLILIFNPLGPAECAVKIALGCRGSHVVRS